MTTDPPTLSDSILLVEVVLYWSAFAFFGRKHTSVIPTVPFFPIGLYAIGLAMNHWIWSWCGTIIVTLLQFGVPLIAFTKFWLDDRRAKKEKKESEK